VRSVTCQWLSFWETVEYEPARKYITSAVCNNLLSPIAERDAFLELLQFIYRGRLSPSLLNPGSASELVKLLTIADRYAVGSLLGAAARAMKALPLTVELCEMLMKVVGENLLSIEQSST
jgi:hypothetical protein